MSGIILASVFDSVDWGQVFVPDTPLLEIFVRGTVIYLSVLVLLRVFVKREVGSMGITDLIVIVFLADAAQNAMAGDYRAVPDGVLLMLVIVGWAYVLDRIAYHVPAFQRLMQPAPVHLVKDGKLDRRNLRREFVTESELMGELRLQGVEDLADVRDAYIEQDGRISVIRRDGQDSGRNEKKRAA